MKKTIAYNLHFCFFLLSWLITTRATQAQAEEVIIPNKILIKLDASVKAQLVTYQRTQHSSLPITGESQLDQLNRRYGVERIRRVFPASARFETAHRRFGLHLWYEITFGDTLSTEVEQLLAQYQHSPSVALAEPLSLRKLDEHPALAIESGIFSDDPHFTDQWHYHNTGQSGGTPLADIRLPAAWAIERGTPQVIVAIIDGGIDTRHEDLQGAMWVNPAEQNGTPNIDDDGNGYIDDVYGYGFGNERSRIAANHHGTHVAGTVGAVSGNGIGVAGVAGGSGVGDGVRLMSCAVFGSGSQGGFPEAFVYAADHGAVIAQNSWGGGEKSILLEDAIRYFTERAGYDNSNENFARNRQIGPMAGGLVVFAAGNNSSEDPESAYPASLPSVFSVAATDHNDQRSDFSNYGNWVDIAAPGSDVLSTSPSNTYRLLSGTSMACPQVSGVAALLISHYQQPGLNPAHIRALLVDSTDPMDEANPRYIGKLGRGRLNAYRALTREQALPPGAITDVVAWAQTYDRVLLRWTASGGDSTQGVAAHYDLRYATFPITTQNFSQATGVVINRPPHPSGTADTVVVDSLSPTTTYYFALKTRDLLSNTSLLSNIATATTLAPPVISVQPASVAVVLEAGTAVNDTIVIANTTGRSTLSFSTITEASWLQVADHSDTVAAGSQVPIVLTMDARPLSEGQYQDTLFVDSNDPAAPRMIVPVQITVMGIPQLMVSSPEIHWKEVWLTATPTAPLTIRNIGTGTLTITRLTTGLPEFQVDTSALVLAPGAHHTVTLTFSPTTLGAFADVLALQSDDPQQPVHEITLSAIVISPPPFIIEPGILTIALTEGEVTKHAIRLRSRSSDTLTWTLATNDSPGKPTWWEMTPSTGRLAPQDIDTIQLVVDATLLSEGIYRDTILFWLGNDRSSDTSLPVTLRIAEKIVPLTITNALPEQQLVLSDTVYQLDVASYVHPNDGQTLHYTAISQAPDLLQVTVDSSRLFLTPQKVGTTTVEVTIRDAFDQETYAYFQVVVIPSGTPEVANPIDTVLMISQENEPSLNLISYPNPSDDWMTAQYDLSQVGSIQLTLHDEYGRFICTLVAQRQAVGQHTVRYRVADLPAGIYFLRLLTQSEAMIHKIVVL